MRRTVVEVANPPFRWVDVVAPDPDELRAIAAEYGFHAMAVEDCLDPWHLPKYEQFGETTFVILRVFDRQCKASAASVQEITRKIAVFFGPGLVVTIHRADLTMVARIREQFANGNHDRCSSGALLGALFNATLDSFEEPLDQAEDDVGEFEDALLNEQKRTPDLDVIHVLKRRVTVIKRLFWQTNSVLQKLVVPGEAAAKAVFQDVKENGESYYFYADQLLDEINNLLSIHVALSSHRTNEVMRVLTVFSAFFLPLTFIVGIYGMNFHYMPELEAAWGYPGIILVMALVCVAIALWFKRKGWWGSGRS